MSKMLSEIQEQPAALERTLLAELASIRSFKQSLDGRRIRSIIPAQLFAAYLSDRKGLNPDQPRGLSKVTLTI